MDGNIEFINIKEAASILGVSVSTIRRWSDSGEIPCCRVGQSQYRKYNKQDILKKKQEIYGDLIGSPIKSDQNTEKIITKSIAAKSHPAHYLMHKYWGRKAHNIVSEYISCFSKEGDTILEPFMGSGVTVVEAAKLKRNVVGIDINPMSKFIVENTISRVNLNCFTERYNEIVSKISQRFQYLYNTTCPHCKSTSTIETAIWENDILVRVKGLCPIHGTFITDATEEDINHYNHISELKKKLLAENKITYPTDSIMQYVKRSGRKSIDELFSDRALIILSYLRDEINATQNAEIRNLLLFCFTSMLSNVSRMLPGDKEKATYKSGWVISKFWTPKINTERNIFLCLQLRYNAILKGKKELTDIDSSLCELYTADASNLSFIENESIDYIFTDPPYGESIAYLALSHFWNSWLPNTVAYEKEIIIDPYREKGYEDYSSRTKAAYSELYRVLKDKHYMSFTFHNRDLNVWKAILDACNEAGFILENIILQEQAVSSGTQGINKKNTLTGDFVYNFKKDTSIKVKTNSSSIDSTGFITDCINEFIDTNNGATPSELYEYIIPIIVQNNAYTDSKGNVVNIENILKSSYDFIETSQEEEKRKIGGAYKWVKKKN